MHRKRSGVAALLLLLFPMLGWASEAPSPEEAPSVPPPEPATREWHYWMRLEATTLALLPRAGVGDDEGFIQVEPTFILDGGPEFGFNLGAPIRFRMWGGNDGGALVRREDWDTLSDWGQLVRGLLLGSDDAPVGVWFGPLEEHKLLSGHLVRRYSNRTNPNYHPAGGIFTGTLGPLYTQAFASDVLGARLVGAEFSLDVEHIFFGQPEKGGRYTLALSSVHDWGRAGGHAPSMTLAHLDAMAIVVARSDLEAHLLAGWGGRPGAGGAWGAVVGGGVDYLTDRFNMRLRLEARRQHGGFRQGFFGADYELARFQAAGPDGVPLADAHFPDGYSAFGEAIVEWDAVSYGGPNKHLNVSVGAEVFSWGRADVDGRVAVQLFERSLEVALKGLAVGAGKPGARYLGAAEVRWRFLGGSLYAMGTGGTLLFPTTEGTLRPGAFASVGLGVDHVR
ncbi:hypothetical protein [Myxococcus landrumensis]|uniref:Alginate export domain-containing protein n=1 Tax=Myxococcus landrumensis TaxID=2813577 RepID=A0ABX7N6C3_9BACT|nr:hypothetical protein [Myxococcus landrumus]QSQ11903.1 hypothetical protein JY572_26390 [Myxococcus landrumus]